MLREAINEIRLHTSRFVATLAAIAISIGFIAAITTLVATEQQGTARSNQPALSQADVVILEAWDESLRVADVVGAVEGVAAVEPAVNQLLMLEANARSVWASVLAVPSEPFRWSEITDGRWPASNSELAVSEEAVEQLGVAVGDSVTVPGQDLTFEVVGTTNDPQSLYSVIAFTDAVGPAGEVDSSQGIWVVDITDREVADVIADIEAALAADDSVRVLTGEDARREALNELTADFDVFRNLLLGFAGIALIVGMIIIANTFTILVAQRRRQIGLLRAVGASPRQVRGRLVAEAVILGLIGSLLGVLLGVGVAAIASVVTGSFFWGLVIDWAGLGLALAIGVLVTVASVVGPALTASRVPPLEALNPVPTGRQERRLGVVRIGASVVLLLGGAALVWLSRVHTDLALVWAIIAGGLISFGVLLAAPLYVPPLSRALSRLVGSGRPTARLAGENTARNPRRAGATAVALMLAVGLIVTLQVGLATVRSSALEAIENEYPIDVSISASDPLEEDYVADLQEVASTARLVGVESRMADIDGASYPVRNPNAAGTAFGIPEKDLVTDGVAVVHPSTGIVDDVELLTTTGTLTLAVTESLAVPINSLAVPEEVFDQLPGEAAVREVWIELTDATSPTAFNQVTKVIDRGPADQVVEGAAIMVGVLTQVVEVILIVMTALLGVAVLIALVGVGNTLGLSVIERQRESALLRALGMQRSSLRLMLLLEALLLAAVGVVVGVAAGAFFGWLGVSSALLMMPAQARFDVLFSVDPWWTLGLIGICLLAAALASVLPGRRAANATPTEALAVD